MPLSRLTLAYALFAALATMLNLGSQWLLLRLWSWAGLGPRLSVWAALVCGTGVGLIVKYVLDKRYIFEDTTTGAMVHARKFTLYSFMGVATTAIFWSAELASSRIDPGGPLIYLGGAIGLTAGYAVKYQLDRRFVFASTPG